MTQTNNDTSPDGSRQSEDFHHCAYDKCRKEFIPAPTARQTQRFCNPRCKNLHWTELRRQALEVLRKENTR